MAPRARSPYLSWTSTVPVIALIVLMALGGRTSQVLGQVLREGMSTALIGTAVGGIGARAIGKALEGTVYGVQAGNPMVFAIVAATLLLAALVACVVPAYRAASIDPMLALRQD